MARGKELAACAIHDNSARKGGPFVAVNRAAFTETPVLEAGDAAADVTGYHAAVREAKKRAVIRPIEQARGSHAEAARSLGLHPNNLHRLIRNLNLKAALGK